MDPIALRLLRGEAERLEPAAAAVAHVYLLEMGGLDDLARSALASTLRARAGDTSCIGAAELAERFGKPGAWIRPTAADATIEAVRYWFAGLIAVMVQEQRGPHWGPTGP